MRDESVGMPPSVRTGHLVEPLSCCLSSSRQSTRYFLAGIATPPHPPILFVLSPADYPTYVSFQNCQTD